MKHQMTFARLIATGLALLVLAVPVSAQTILNNTTLAAAVNSTQTTITVASASTLAVGQIIFVPGLVPESMRITSISGTTIGVIRGSDGTRAVAHSNSARVFTGPGERFYARDPDDAGGVCTPANQPYMPWINLQTGYIWTCAAWAPLTVSSTWVVTQVTPVTFNSIGQLR